MNQSLIVYLAAVNILAFILFGTDKYKAVHHRWRISERTLFTTAIIGGSLGSIAGMYAFRHKTKHASFTMGMPAILLIQLALYYLLTRAA